VRLNHWNIWYSFVATKWQGQNIHRFDLFLFGEEYDNPFFNVIDIEKHYFKKMSHLIILNQDTEPEIRWENMVNNINLIVTFPL